MSKIRFTILTAAAMATLAAIASPAHAQTVVAQKILSLDGAQAIAQAALEKCRADGYRAAITILDPNGMVKVTLRDDGSSAQTVEVSRKKAYTALIYRRPSIESAKGWAAAPPMPNIDGIIALGGGVPIKAGNDTIGAIGVSGAPGQDKDEACANAGIAKMADKLK
jgi:uncharacterized protein GlcG (DUF336 family)